MKSELFDGFYIEHLQDCAEHHSLISQFQTKATGYGLTAYLQQSALYDEISGKSRTYLVRDSNTKELVGYFSLRSGHVATRKTIGPFFFRLENVPGIEISNFAVNEIYRKSHHEYKYIGELVFLYYIFPLVKKVATMVGVHCIYIYALPYPGLLQYYKSLGFHRLKNNLEKYINHYAKPYYDKGCVFMYQTL